MRAIFMGTPEFAVPSLAALCGIAEVACVVTQPDKPRGRGQKLLPPPVKVFATEKNLPVLQPPKIKLPEVVAELEKFRPDLIVVVAFGQILSQAILDLPRLGCINVHASLLPRYRGAAPVEWSIIRGEKTTGITTMKMNAGLDTGDILLQREIEIGGDMILPELRDKMQSLGAELLVETVENLSAIEPVAQDDTRASYAPLLKKDTGRIDWSSPAADIHNLVRGLYGGAFGFIGGQKFKIWRTKIAARDIPAGEIQIAGGRFFVGTGSGALEILEIQAPNSRKLDAENYLRGHKIAGRFD